MQPDAMVAAITCPDCLGSVEAQIETRYDARTPYTVYTVLHKIDGRWLGFQSLDWDAYVIEAARKAMQRAHRGHFISIRQMAKVAEALGKSKPKRRPRRA